MSTAAVTAGHADLTDLADRLIVEYRGVLPAGVVMRCVARTYHLMRASGVVNSANYVEDATRRRLAERAGLLLRQRAVAAGQYAG